MHGYKFKIYGRGQMPTLAMPWSDVNFDYKVLYSRDQVSTSAIGSLNLAYRHNLLVVQ